MRLWHKDLISVLPRQQLLSQWRECCCIAKNLNENGTPNHLLVNKILDYPISHFKNYTELIIGEIENRGYKISTNSELKFLINIYDFMKSLGQINDLICFNDLFSKWHNDRYFWQCYYNLQEKYDCGGITKEEWQKIEERAREYGDL